MNIHISLCEIKLLVLLEAIAIKNCIEYNLDSRSSNKLLKPLAYLKLYAMWLVTTEPLTVRESTLLAGYFL